MPFNGATGGLQGRNLYELYKMNGEKRKQALALRRGVELVQRLWRGRQGKKSMITLMRSIVKKYVDPDCGLPYWYNPQSGAVTWKKPVLLGTEDVDDTITLPSQGLEWTVLCGKCTHLSANVYCNANFFCDECFEKKEDSGEMKGMERARLDMCIECGYQIATRRCEQCNDDYCDSCFASKHRRGRLMHHSWKGHVKMCEYCHPTVTATSVRIVSYADGRESCKQCFWNVTGTEAVEGVNCDAYSLYTEGMRVMDEHIEAERKEAAMQRARELRMEQERHLWESNAALKLQSIWRMKKAFLEHGGELDNLRVARILLERKQKRDAMTAQSMAYRLKDLVGRAPLLDTDDEGTKARKLEQLQKSGMLALVGSVKMAADKQVSQLNPALALSAAAERAKQRAAQEKQKALDQTAGARLKWQKGLGSVNTFLAKRMKGVAEFLDEEEGVGKWLMTHAEKKAKQAEQSKEIAKEIAQRIEDLNYQKRKEVAWKKAVALGWEEVREEVEGEEQVYYYNSSTHESTWDFPAYIQTQEEYERDLDEIAISGTVDHTIAPTTAQGIITVAAGEGGGGGVTGLTTTSVSTASSEMVVGEGEGGGGGTAAAADSTEYYPEGGAGGEAFPHAV